MHCNTRGSVPKRRTRALVLIQHRAEADVAGAQIDLLRLA
jgi:hypothetical protein